MHPFCCANTVPVSPVAGASSTFPPPRMPPPPPPSPPPVRNEQFLHHSASARSTRSAPPASPRHSSTTYTNGFRWQSRPTLSADFSSMRSSFHDVAAEVRLNDIVGSGIAGILHKWVNYGRGWRPRWFVLQDGVLSYYKIHGPDRIQLEEEADKGSMVIGEDSMRRLSRHRRNGSNYLNSFQRKPIGEVHLKVATVRESRSDDRRFSIFTGTKRLHLRAETREDRAAWMEALQAVKEMFPRISNSELMAPVDNFVVSTDKLRQRLVEEGLSEAAIQDSELIMRSEFSVLQGQLAILKQKQLLLIDTLRQLETEKVDLENTLVTESQRQSKEHASTSLSRNDKFSEASVTESEDDNERQDAAEEETEDEDNTFFDTQDFLSSSSFKSSASDFLRSEIGSDDEEHFGISVADCCDSSVSYVGFNHPYVRRRKNCLTQLRKRKE
ncbi:hypothetical protein HPP92_005492 [Vanilla planifolia]|uniref:PH domain-containing protein n=1 Tax=Vanilla planifolia TaxID=51239 RepID=A0A835RUP6_VANPL|nr:hypothetical protein HPP92_005851 [Vanilla planifolia]KAG0494498.1 hypothetical protein HPP92_005492 [Vanilla planifolia]